MMKATTDNKSYLTADDNKELSRILGDYGWPWVGKAVPIYARFA